MEYPFLQLWVNDWRNDPDIKTMSLEEEGLMFRLVQELWEHETLPNDPKKLAIFCRVNIKTFKRLWPMISNKFQIENELISHKRVDQEKMKLKSKSEKARKSVEKRWNKDTNVSKTNKRSGYISESESETESDSPKNINTKKVTKIPTVDDAWRKAKDNPTQDPFFPESQGNTGMSDDAHEICKTLRTKWKSTETAGKNRAHVQVLLQKLTKEQILTAISNAILVFDDEGLERQYRPQFRQFFYDDRVVAELQDRPDDGPGSVEAGKSELRKAIEKAKAEMEAQSGY